MSTASTIHREMIRTIERHDLDALRAAYHSDYTYTGGDGVEQKGAEAGVAIAQTYTTAFPDLRFEILHEHGGVRDDISIIECCAHGTQTGELDGIPPTGKTVDAYVCNIIEVRDGKILREREYFDSATMLRQLGLLED